MHLLLKILLVTLALLLTSCGSESSAQEPAGVSVVTQSNTPVISAPQTEPGLSAATAAATLQEPVSGAVGATQPASTSTDTSTPPPAPFPSALPQPDTAKWQAVASGLENPIGIAAPADGSGRLFVLEQPGRIRVIRDGDLLDQPFLDITGQVGCCGERGLLGLAFHPGYSENRYFYINYTDRNGDTSISRFQVFADDPDVADSGSEKRLLYVPQPYPNHNGGAVVFGPDGYLYLGLGDGGSGGDPHGNGQSTQTLLGKILRIDVDGGDPYAIPPDNPFVAGGGLPEIWAYGLRNPWRLAFDPANGDLYIGDVGQNAYEEIDYFPAGSGGGANFGWNYREAAHPFQGNPPGDLSLIDPVAEYGHDQGCSVTGGVVYRGAALPDWHGVYLYGDYCSGLVWGLRRTPEGSWQSGLLYETGGNVASFGEDEAGEVYLADYSGTVYRLSPAQ